MSDDNSENLIINSTSSMNSNASILTSDNSSSTNYTLRNVIIIFCYTLIVIVSLCGNLLVVKVVSGKRKMRTTTNMLIASLACSDLLVTSFNIPFNVARLLLVNWPFGNAMCFLVPFIQTSCVYVSTFTMTVIAVHRWWTVTKSTSSRAFSCIRLVIVVIIIWSLALTLSLPHTVFNVVKPATIGNRNVSRCRYTFPDFENFDFRLFLTVEVFLTQYLTPLVITCIVYIKIAFIVSAQGRLAANASDERRRQQSDAKRRRIVMLALVVCVFALCWMPLNVYYLLVDFKVIGNTFTLFIICHWFAMSSVCYNPFIYCWLNESFRKGADKFLSLFTRCCRNWKVPDSTTNTNQPVNDSKHRATVNTVIDKEYEKTAITPDNV